MDWRTIDRWLMGEAWTGSRIGEHLWALCEEIGPRWSSSAGERRAIEYIHAQMQAAGLDHAAVEPFDLHTWAHGRAEAAVVASETEPERSMDVRPFNRCPPVDVQAPIVDVGFGTPREIEGARAQLPRAVALMALAFEPFTEPIPHDIRLNRLAAAGAAAVMVVERKMGRRMEYNNAGDWRDPTPDGPPLPTVTTSHEHGILLRRLAGEGRQVWLNVESRFYTAPSANVAAELSGERWPDEHLLLGGHHDTVLGVAGGNDNASGVIAVLETARLLAQLRAEMGIAPGRSIRFVTFAAEEQKFQGTYAYIARHYGPDAPPRLAINLDELSTGNMKGIVLAFPHLRDLVQGQLDHMDDGLRCHVMSQLDCTSDHFPFLRAGMDAAHLWRWRFVGRHAGAEFHHETADTADKVNVRELKEYAGQLARLLLRLSHIAPDAWPRNPVTPGQVLARLEEERGAVIRVF